MIDRLQRAISPDARRRIAITIAALLVIDVMGRVPLPGIDFSRLLGSHSHGGVFGPLAESSMWARLSIGALNITPLFSAFLLFELWRTVSGKFYGGDLGGPEQPQILRWIVAAALVMAAFQAWGIATALEHIRPTPRGRLIAEPGLAFRLSIVASLVGATAVIAWLMTVITRHGVGSGLWILFASSIVHQFGTSAVQFYELHRAGAIAPTSSLLFLGFCAAAVALLVALDKATDDRGRVFALDPWAPIMGLYLYFTWMFGMRFLWPDDDGAGFTQAFTPFAPGGWGFAIGFPLFVAGVAALRVVRFNAGAAQPQPLSRAAPAIGTMVVICFAAALLAALTDGAMVTAHTILPVIVTVLAAMQALLPTPQKDT